MAELDDAVRKRRDRRERGRREGEGSLAHDLAMVGVLGWTIVVPGLLGVALGRLLDHTLGTGIVFSAALLVVGIALGCVLAWRRMHA